MGTTLVTGATGFVGAAIVRRLVQQGCAVRITIRKTSSRDNIRGFDLECCEADICDRASMDRALQGVTRLYHIAGLYRTWMPDYSRLRQVNVAGTRTVLEAARDAGVEKIVYTSSIAALGVRSDGKPSGEDVPFNQHHLGLPYEESKYEAECVAADLGRQGLPLVIVRPALVMGAGDIYPTPSGKLVLDVLKGAVPSYFDGGIDVVDVDDVAAGHVLAMEQAAPGQTYNLGCVGNFTLMGDLMACIARVGGVRAPVLRVPVRAALAWAAALKLWADHVSHREPVATPANIRALAQKKRIDFSKAVRELGIPQTPLEEVVRKTVQFYRSAGYV